MEIKNKNNKLESLIGKVMLSASWFGIDGGTISETYSDENGIIDAAVNMLNFVAGLGALAAVAFVIFGGFTFLTAGGDADKYKKAQGTIVNALVGLVIIFFVRMGIMFVIDTVAGFL